ncbi:GDSL-type esterase/lipase family protein [Methylobacterium oryzae CBMB20]
MSTPMQDKPLFPFGPILFFGDSVTAELVAENPMFFSGPQTVARGIAGQSIRDMGRRLRSEIALYGARGLHLIGGRDDILSGRGVPSLDSIVADFAAMLQDARDLHVRTWVGSIPPVDPASPAATGLPIPLIGQVNAWLRNHVQAYGAQFIDYDAVLTTEAGALKPGLSDDGVRLNAVGYAALRDTMMAALTAPGVEQIWAPPESEDAARRRKFLHHFGYLDSNTRYPSPFIQFAGKPGASHYGVPFDADGFLNAAPIVERKPEGETRILVVGDSTTIDGGDIANTLPGRIERILRADGLESAKVYNFGVMSSCLTQMTHLIWSRLVTYNPDAILVLSGSTDLFQPWTYDPRPGHPYNAFITQRLYDHFFDTHDPRAREDGLSYEALITLIYEELKRLQGRGGLAEPRLGGRDRPPLRTGGAPADQAVPRSRGADRQRPAADDPAQAPPHRGRKRRRVGGVPGLSRPAIRQAGGVHRAARGTAPVQAHLHGPRPQRHLPRPGGGDLLRYRPLRRSRPRDRRDAARRRDPRGPGPGPRPHAAGPGATPPRRSAAIGPARMARPRVSRRPTRDQPCSTARFTRWVKITESQGTTSCSTSIESSTSRWSA